MAHEVFISYARAASAGHARALAERLGDLAFFDTEDIKDGDPFPQRLLDGVLDARVVVIFATKTYAERRFCRLEMGLALADGPAHVMVAIGDGAHAVMDAMPRALANQNWPAAAETDQLASLVKQRLAEASDSIRARLGRDEARAITAVFREQSQIQEPLPLPAARCSVPPGVASQSIGKRFVGRADELAAIHYALLDGASGGGAAQLTSRIAAGGGFGKTRLAVEYFHRYGPKHYPGGLFWLNAAAGDLEGEFHRILQALVPATPDLAQMRAQKRNIFKELEQALRAIRQPVLYVVDDIPEAAAGEAPRAMSEYCPALGTVTVLATSRQKSGEAGVKSIPLDTLKPEAAILLLTEDLPDLSVLSWSEWGETAAWVGYLPLALDLLNRAMAMGSINAPDLLKRATTSGGTAELDRLSEALRGQVPRGAVRGITEALQISVEKLEGPAREVAKVLAQLAPGAAIPNELVDALGEPASLLAVRAALQTRHFVTGGDGGASFGAMHRLMADYLRTTMGRGTEVDVLRRVCAALVDVMAPDRCRDPREWPSLNLYRSHAEEVFAQGVVETAYALEASEIGLRAGLLAAAQGDCARARQFNERAVEVRMQLLGEDHPDTLVAINNLAGTLRTQGDYGGARTLQEHVVRAQILALGTEHPNTLTSLSNLAVTLRVQGDYDGARNLHERALDARRRVLGEEHPDTLMSTSNLAEMLRAQGDYAGARSLQERVLETHARLLGEDHPDTLVAINNLAGTLQTQGDYASARAWQEQVLKARKRVLGEEHPDTLLSMNNLAETLRAQGDYVGARNLQERVSEVQREVLGEEHPDTLTSMSNLAVTLGALGDARREREIEESIVEIRRRVLGDEHPDTLLSMNNLAETLRAQGDYMRARDLQERVSQAQRRMLGEEHPDTLLSINNLAITTYQLGDVAAARLLLRQCLERQVKVLGAKHPDTLGTMANLRVVEAYKGASA